MPNTVKGVEIDPIREKLIELMTAFYGVDPMYYGVEAQHLADHLISNGVTVQQWIPVTERLPNPFTPVLVYRQSFGTLPPYIKVDKMTLWYDDTQVWTDEVGNWKNVTTHWMPLPEPPKGE